MADALTTVVAAGQPSGGKQTTASQFMICRRMVATPLQPVAS
jgi:hypothetical protein